MNSHHADDDETKNIMRSVRRHEEAREFEAANVLLRRAAHRGSVVAIEQLADNIRNGKGAEKNEALANEWLCHMLTLLVRASTASTLGRFQPCDWTDILKSCYMADALSVFRLVCSRVAVDPQSALVDALAFHAAKVCDALVDGGAVSLDSVDVLLAASRGGVAEKMQMVLSAFCGDIDATAADGCTALMLAANVRVAQMLINAGASLVLLDSERNSALMHAAIKRDAELLRCLLEAKKPAADVNCVNKRRETALLLAANSGTCIKVLLEHGANANLADRGGRLPLMFAADGASAELLLRAGARATIDCADRRKQTALHYAAERGAADVCAALLDAGARLPRDAVRFFKPGMSTALVRSLLRAGMDPNAQLGRYEGTVLMQSWAQTAWISLFAEAGYDFSPTSVGGQTVLETGRAPGDLVFLRELLTHAPELVQCGHEYFVPRSHDWINFMLACGMQLDNCCVCVCVVCVLCARAASPESGCGRKAVSVRRRVGQRKARLRLSGERERKAACKSTTRARALSCRSDPVARVSNRARTAGSGASGVADDANHRIRLCAIFKLCAAVGEMDSCDDCEAL
jgi:ankyrin repeat protein